MKRSWTKEQQQAIDARGGNILVSAAAGSGKTAVLVERIVKKLTDSESPSSVDRLLVVTFTRAAAGEIKQRIADAFEKELAKNPGNRRLMNQQLLLPSAKFCTIDSFCSSLVRDNFELLDLSPDFKIADEGELKLLSEQAMTLTLEEMYESANPDFFNLVELLFRGRDDSMLGESILELYKIAVSYPFSDQWLSMVEKNYSSTNNIADNVYGKIIFNSVEAALGNCEIILSVVRSVLRDDDFLNELFFEAFESDYNQLSLVKKAFAEKNWDKTKRAVELYDPIRRKSAPRGYSDDGSIAYISSLRDDFKDILRKDIPSLLCTTEGEFESDMKYLSPMVSQLVKAVKVYADYFSDLKKEKKLADFNDIAHYALSLLVEKDESGNVKKTELAKRLSEEFDEILIDEYQDTNKAQDLLFDSISKNNLFRVGDVKQSIYRFRQAMPEIFVELKKSYSLYSEEEKAFPAKVVLKNNFRSRKSVTGAVNFVFSQIMSEETGGVDYADEEQLVCSASYPEKADDCCELHLIDLGDLDTELDSSDEYQADYTARLINSMLESGFTVSEKGTERKAQYKDFCILIRSVNTGKGVAYAEALKRHSIPCFSEVAADFFTSHEVNLVLNLLRIIDNPKQDIPLMSVMMSHLFGFTVDRIASLRINSKKGNLYSCLLASAEGGDEKSKAFLEKISLWRSLGVCMSVSDFLRMIYDETAIISVVSASKGSQAKKMNLMLLLDYAATYEQAGYIGLSGFIRFIDRLESSGNDLAGSVGITPDADVVKIMSIHKSKGLEFPVCIVANCASVFNRNDQIKNIVFSSKSGAGIVRRDTKRLAQFPTVCHRAVRAANKTDMISEEMRVLYVAMTRARERLILVSACKNLEKSMFKYGSHINPLKNTMDSFRAGKASCYADWLIPALLRHKDSQCLRDTSGCCDDSVVLESDFSLKVVTSKWEERKEKKSQKEEAAKTDSEFLKLVEERLSWRYDYEPLTQIVSKRAASEVDKNFVDRDYFASSSPAFLGEGGLTPAQRGIATHSFMQFADYGRAKDNVKEEIARLFEKGVISESEAKAINVRAVEGFFKSDLARRMLKSSLVMREKKFTIKVPVSELYEGLEGFGDEYVMIQGIADCAFLEEGKLVVVDYKTDRLDTEAEFVEKYSSQVAVYKKALSLCTDYEVGETLLYSFRLSKAIKVE